MNYISEPVFGIKKEEIMDPGVNQKYVNLLQNTFEKYKSLDSRRQSSVNDHDKDDKEEETPTAKIIEIKTRTKSSKKVGPGYKKMCSSASKLEVTQLLKKSIEKYQNIEKAETVLKSKEIMSQNQEQKTIDKKSSAKSSTCKGEHPKTNELRKDFSCRSYSTTKRFENNEKKRNKVKTFRFSKEEDEVLLAAFKSAGITADMKKLPKGFLKGLSKKLNRDEPYLRDRFKLLQDDNFNLNQVRFTLLDDKALIDAAVENIKMVGSLRNSVLSYESKNELAVKLKRNKKTLSPRWLYKLKPWILSYYEKTLNLDIRIMLASFVVENFNTVYDIDWDLVMKNPEFSGHTAGSVRRIYIKMIELTAKHLKERVECVTISQVAEDAKITYTRTNSKTQIKQTIKRRQMEVIEYFEEVIKLNKIENFL